MNKKALFFLTFFLILRVFLFNVNISEWGDSYHIVEAAENLRSDFSYPIDEKRLPFFSVLIALNPFPVEMMVWAKILQALLTAGILFLTYKLARRFFPDLSESLSLVPCFLLLLSPVFLYWSIRVVAGVLLTFLVLLAFEVYYSKHRWRLPLLGVVCGLAALTRYEGFLLAAAFGLPLLLSLLKSKVPERSEGFLFLVSFILTVSPWFIRNFLVFGNPLHSTYFSEPSTYTYNVQTVFIFLASLVFLFGFPPAFFTQLLAVPNLFGKVREALQMRNPAPDVVRGPYHLPLLIFIFLELLLILLWPAAVPRLFLPLIPFFTIFIVGSLNTVEAGQRKKLLVVSLVLTALYVLLQYSLRLHFLVLSKSGLVLIGGLGFLSAISWLVFDLDKAKKTFLGLFLASEIVASFVVINNHRLIYSDALQAAQFAASLEGVTGYSDETGVVKYYLGDKGRKLPDDLKEPQQQWEWLQENKIDYLLATDEYEQLSRFEVADDADYEDRFTLIRSWEVEAADAFDSFLMRQGLFPRRDYPTKYAKVFEVLE